MLTEERKIELLANIAAAESACAEIANEVFEVGDWVRGHAEGASIAKAQAAEQALMTLRSSLTIRLGWKEPEAEEAPREVEA